MARQYFRTAITDSGVWTAQAAVSPGTTATSILAINQSNAFLPLPYGQNKPSPGQMFHFYVSGLITTPASGTLIFAIYHGPGTSTTAFGTLIATATTFTPTASMTAGYFEIEGNLIYRVISEIATTSTVWCSGRVACSGPSGGSLALTGALFASNSAVSVDTTGTGSSGTFGALNIAVTPSVTGSTFTPEIVMMESVN